MLHLLAGRKIIGGREVELYVGMSLQELLDFGVLVGG
jgi:hypothetical protein